MTAQYRVREYAESVVYLSDPECTDDAQWSEHGFVADDEANALALLSETMDGRGFVMMKSYEVVIRQTQSLDTHCSQNYFNCQSDSSHFTFLH